MTTPSLPQTKHVTTRYFGRLDTPVYDSFNHNVETQIMPLRGGKKLDRLIREAGRRGPRAVRFGYTGNDVYPDGTPVHVAAMVNEFGAPEHGIPERPAFRQSLRSILGDLRAELRRGFKASVGYVDRPTAERIGKTAQAHVRASVRDLRNPPNAPATLEGKTGTNPLIDSGKLADAVRYEVLD